MSAPRTITLPGRPEPLPAATALMIVVFLFSYLIPGNITVASVTMGFPRLILTLALIPTTFMLLTDPRYKLTWVDALVAIFAFWVFVSILVNHGLAQLQFAGLQVIQTFGAYTLGRILLRTPAAYRFFWRVFGYFMLFMLPIAFYELLTERFLLHELLSPFIDTFENATNGIGKRMGFDRVQGNLEHQILFGVFWSFGFLHFLSVFDNRGAQIFFMSCCVMMVFMSLSSGAYLAIIMQTALLIWAIVTKERWKLLAILFAVFYVVVEIISDRPAIVAISTRLAFSADTAYWRVHIFEYGMNNVWANPIFGLGLRDWARPHWLTSSVDNQWLLTAMRSGIPALLMQLGAFGVMVYMLARRKNLPQELQKYRRNFLIAFAGLSIALGTVAVWSGTQAFLWVLLAMGTSMALYPGTSADAADNAAADVVDTRRRPGAARPASPVIFTRPGAPATAAAGAATTPLPYSRSAQTRKGASAERAKPRRHTRHDKD